MTPTDWATRPRQLLSFSSHFIPSHYILSRVIHHVSQWLRLHPEIDDEMDPPAPMHAAARSNAVPTIRMQDQGSFPSGVRLFLTTFTFSNVAPARQSVYDQPAWCDTRSNSHALMRVLLCTSERQQPARRSGLSKTRRNLNPTSGLPGRLVSSARHLLLR